MLRRQGVEEETFLKYSLPCASLSSVVVIQRTEIKLCTTRELNSNDIEIPVEGNSTATRFAVLALMPER